MHPDQLVGGLPVFYVDFVYNSIHYRIAQNAITAKQDGTEYQYTDGLLQFDFVEAANVGGDVETNTVGCQLAMPGVNVIVFANRGLGVDGLQCEFGALHLAQW